METYSFLADRKLAKCINNNNKQVGSDRYVELYDIPSFEDIWTLLDSGDIQTINGVAPQRIGNMFKFKIMDSVDKSLTEANIARMKNQKIRLRLGEYADSIQLIVGQIVSLSRIINGTNCELYVKSGWLFKYIFESVGQNNRYILRSQSCNNIKDELNFLSFINVFGIVKTEERETEGRDSYDYIAYTCEGATSKYIGLPFSCDLEAKYFEKLDIKVLKT